ncbi:hypothetical protein BOX15_Mlig016714g2 [Macrostomum lignano]|uniref:Uncharacterized protein n=2 Tax=Macrostomum lignano TaxID=282301 RepID=A0A1I8J8B4_9PLAT|nr:hypothetical protein BOX15_Mlig016714g2 [Macrostomum lignano]
MTRGQLGSFTQQKSCRPAILKTAAIKRQCPTSPPGSSSESGTATTAHGTAAPCLLMARRQQRQRLVQQAGAAGGSPTTTRCIFGGCETSLRGQVHKKEQKSAQQKPSPVQQSELTANNLCAEGTTTPAAAAASDAAGLNSTSSSFEDASQARNSHYRDPSPLRPGPRHRMLAGQSRSDDDYDDEESEETRKARMSSLALKKQFIYYEGKMKTVLVQLWPDANRIPLHERHRLQDPMKKHYGRLSQRARLLKEFENNKRKQPREIVEVPLLPRRMQQEAKVRLMAWYQPISLTLAEPTGAATTAAGPAADAQASAEPVNSTDNKHTR